MFVISLESSRQILLLLDIPARTSSRQINGCVEAMTSRQVDRKVDVGDRLKPARKVGQLDHESPPYVLKRAVNLHVKLGRSSVRAQKHTRIFSLTQRFPAFMVYK